MSRNAGVRAPDVLDSLASGLESLRPWMKHEQARQLGEQLLVTLEVLLHEGECAEAIDHLIGAFNHLGPQQGKGRERLAALLAHRLLMEGSETPKTWSVLLPHLQPQQVVDLLKHPASATASDRILLARLNGAQADAAPLWAQLERLRQRHPECDLRAPPLLERMPPRARARIVPMRDTEETVSAPEGQTTSDVDVPGAVIGMSQAGSGGTASSSPGMIGD